jgi:hypothetical protein
VAREVKRLQSFYGNDDVSITWREKNPKRNVKQYTILTRLLSSYSVSIILWRVNVLMYLCKEYYNDLDNCMFTIHNGLGDFQFNRLLEWNDFWKFLSFYGGLRYQYWSIDCLLFYVPLENLQLIIMETSKGCKFQTYTRRWGPLSREGSLSGNTCCDTCFPNLIWRTAPLSRLLRQGVMKTYSNGFTHYLPSIKYSKLHL